MPITEAQLQSDYFTARAYLTAMLAAGSLLGGSAIASEPPDPFSTNGLVAASNAGSAGKPLMPSPCDISPLGKSPLALADVVEHALCNNPQTREAWANARFQAAQVGVSEAAYLPSVAVGAGETRNWTDGGASAARSSSGSSNYNQLSATATLSYLLYDFGARDAALENARQILAALNATQDATLQSVFLAALQGYYQLFAAQAAVDSALAAEQSALESLNAATARHKIGSGTPADKLQAQTAHSQAVLNRIQAEGNARNAQGVLANSMGLDANRAFAIAPPAVRMPDARFDGDVARLIEDARRLRPDVAAAAAQVNAAKASAEAAKASGMPTVSLATNVNRTHSSSADPANGAALGVSINFPLFTGYGTTYRIRAAQEQVETRLAQLERLRQQVALDVWKAYQGLVTGTQAVSSSTDLVASASASERVALGRYKAGVGNILDLLTAQTALANARLQHIQALYNWYIAKAALAQAMGQLDFSALEPSAPAKISP